MLLDNLNYKTLKIIKTILKGLMGNNQSKLVPAIYFSPAEQKILDNAKYLDRQIFRATSVRKKLSLEIQNIVDMNY